MNIGIVVNARGKMCLVHDERFPGIPEWIGYHIDKRQIEIVFEDYSTYPIDWAATDEMHGYIMRINKILLICMENRKPVEGYDTSLVGLFQANIDADLSRQVIEGVYQPLVKFRIDSQLL